MNENQKGLLNSLRELTKQYKTQILGIGALLGGFLIIYIERIVVVDLAIFLGGIVLIYLGLKLLKLTFITNFIDAQVNRIVRK